PDIVEIYFSNITNIDNNTTWAQMCQNYSGLANYQWCREYYWSINGSDRSKAENWTQKAFNPFVVCNLPPMIVKFTISWCSSGGLNPEYYIYAELKAFDLSAVREVKYELYDLCWNKKVATETSTFTEDYTCVSTSKVFRNLDWWTYQFYGYKVVGTVKNGAGFTVCIEGKVMGEIAGFANYIASGISALLGMLTGGLQSVWNKVAKGVEVIVEWAKQKMREILIQPVELLAETTENYVRKFANTMPPKERDIDAISRTIQNKVTAMFSDFTMAMKKAASIACVFGLKEIMNAFVEIIKECAFKIYGWTGITQMQPVVTEEEAREIWAYLKERVKDMSSMEDWRKFTVNSIREWMGTQKPSESHRMFIQQSGDRYAIVIGEYDANLEGAVKHDVEELYKILPQKGFTMITIPGKPNNLQLTKNEIKKVFEDLKKNLTQNSFVFIVFVGHGSVDANGSACYALGDGTNYPYSELAWDFDSRILDRNGDNIISDEERRNPIYSTLVVVFQTCFSRHGIDAFMQNDPVGKRVLISACDYDEISQYLYGWYTFFLGHFTNKLQNDYAEEFEMSFVQALVAGIILTLVPTLILSELVWWLVWGLLWALTWGIASCIHMSRLGNTLYDAVYWGNIWARYGFSGLAKSSHPYIYNPDLAKEVVI
ncbi:MAG: hypothetical protein ACPL1Y_06300, partial [Thermoplasmata archaeon]